MKVSIQLRNLVNQLFWLIMSLNTLLVSCKPPSCSTCKTLASNFDKALEKTAKSHFGGGDADWEGSRLGNFLHSETRLIEVVEELYSLGKDTNAMLEKYEDNVEQYWFKEFSKAKRKDFHEWFCIEDIKACCPKNMYGEECTPCLGGSERPCYNNGQCDGEGTREGTGKCKCDDGYVGELCDNCTTGFYEKIRSDTSVQCTECDEACNGCTSGGRENCVDCKKEYYKEEDICKKCDSACYACTGSGADECIHCSSGYTRTDNTCVDIDECESKCQGDNEVCLNSPGNYECDCSAGYVREGSTCVKEQTDDDIDDEDETEESSSKDENEREEL